MYILYTCIDTYIYAQQHTENDYTSRNIIDTMFALDENKLVLTTKSNW